MTARGSSPAHEAPTQGLSFAESVAWTARYICSMDGRTWESRTAFQQEQYCNGAREILRVFLGLDLPSLRREAQIDILADSALCVREEFVGVGDNTDLRRIQDNWARRIARYLEARAQALREGKD